MSTITLNKGEAQSIVYEDHQGFEIIEDEIIETSRWSEIHALVVKRTDGKFFSVSYSQGLTEMQNESPFEYEDTVDLTEVVPKEVTVIKYVVKE